MTKKIKIPERKIPKCRICHAITVHHSTCPKRVGTEKNPLPLYGPHVMVKPEDCD